MGLNDTVLLIEPFYVGSHRQLMDLLHAEISSSSLVTLPGKKWHWKARTSALTLSQTVPKQHSFRTLFASSVLNLAELVALRHDLAHIKKVLYFHENQLCYPVRKQHDRDFQYGYNQIISCLVADVVVFNSQYNMESFLSHIKTFLKIIPDHRPKDIAEQIKDKCRILYFPISFPNKDELKRIPCGTCSTEVLTDDKMLNKDKQCDNAVTMGQETMIVIPQTNIEQVANTGLVADHTGLVADHTGLVADHTGLVADHTGLVADTGLDYCVEDSKVECHVSDRTQTCTVTTEENLAIESLKSGISQLPNTVGCEEMKREYEQSDVSEGSVCEMPRKRCKLSEKPLHIVWPHRWEHDKNAESLFKVMIQLQDAGCDFTLSVVGENYSEIPGVFEESYPVLKDKILHWGYQKNKHDYFNILQKADIVISTANHEFFGVAILEAVHLGCYPLVPNRLVYPEIFSGDNLYNTDQQLFKKLRSFCRNPAMLRRKFITVDTSLYSWTTLKPRFVNLLSSTDT